MKLIKVKIYGFGKWIDQEFDIKSDYQIIFGNNEVGKTTFLNFIKSILFGFSSSRGNSKYEQYRPKNGSTYGGELEFVDTNDVHWLVRRIDGKGDGDLALFRNEQQVPNSLISEITSDFNKNDFEATHVFDEKTINTIYNLDEPTLENEILMLGAAGSKEWLSTADGLENDSSEIYKARGTKQPLVLTIKKYQQLVKERATFQNQQVKYREIKNDLDQVNLDIAKIEDRYQNLTNQVNYFNNLSKELPEYREMLELKSLSLNEKNKISSDDWESFLKLEQQVKTLKQSQRQQIENKITPEEDAFLDNYHSNQADIDYIYGRRNDIQNSIFKAGQLEEELRKSEYEINSLKQQYPEIDENMSFFSTEELQDIKTQPENKNNFLAVGIALLAIVLLFFVPTTIKVVLGIIAVGSIVWAVYQFQQNKLVDQNNEMHNKEILKKHNLQQVSVQQAVDLQSPIMELVNKIAQRHELQEQLSRSNRELNKWKDLFLKVGILTHQTLSKDFVPEINQFFTQLDRINAKEEVIVQDRIDRKKVLGSSNQNLENVARQVAELIDKYQVSNQQSFIQMHEAQQSQSKQISRLKNIQEHLGTDIQEFEKIADLSQISVCLQEAQVNVDTTGKQRNKLMTQKGYLESQMKQIFDDQAYQKLVEDITQTKVDMLEQYDEWLADKLASEWIRKMLNLASENRYPKMLKRAKRYFNTLTNGNYIDISMGKEKQLSLTRNDKTKFNVRELSKATTVQLYISLRLAFIVEISAIVDLPILIDDAFVDFDTERIKTVFKLVEDIAKDNQVIYVTANLHESISSDHVLSFVGGNNG